MIWFIWAIVLLAQNFSFTFVSRARNSGSIKRHVIAALLSNGVWFTSQVIMFSQLLELLTGKHGWATAVYTGLFYTAFTILGSVVGHYVSLATEKGKGAVGANSKYAQITKEEWEAVKLYYEKWESTRKVLHEVFTELGPVFCTRTHHDGPCNGLPREECLRAAKSWEDDNGPVAAS